MFIQYEVPFELNDDRGMDERRVKVKYYRDVVSYKIFYCLKKRGPRGETSHNFNLFSTRLFINQIKSKSFYCDCVWYCGDKQIDEVELRGFVNLKTI